VSIISASILDSVKRVLGIVPSYDAFDTDIIMHINTVFSVLHQLGIGPIDGFEIEDAGPVWSNFLGDVKMLNMVKTYVQLRVRVLFDPPTTSYLADAMRRQIDELEWRINVYREGQIAPLPVPEVVSP
jgi:hypothetical protein